MDNVTEAVKFIMANWNMIGVSALVVIGACSTIVAAITPLVKLTAWQGDDKAVSIIGKALDMIHAVLSKIALNPTEKNAR